MTDHHQRELIMVQGPHGKYEERQPPEGYSWIPYSPRIEMDGNRYEYFYCKNAYPYYRFVETVNVEGEY